MGKDCHRSSLKCGAEEVSRARVLCGETTEQCASQYKVPLPSINGASSKDCVLHPLTALAHPTTSGMGLSVSEKSIINQRYEEIGTFLTGQIDSSKTAGGAVCSSSGEICGSSFTLPIFSQPSEDPYVRIFTPSLRILVYVYILYI